MSLSPRQIRESADGARFSHNGVLNDNSAEREKVLLREYILEHVKPARVLDLYCGLGAMRNAVWARAESWAGCDARPLRNGEATRYVADNLDLLKAIDLSKFNVFDFDSYGSPWDQIVALGDRRRFAPGETGAIVLTDGTGLSGQFGRLRRHLAPLLGLRNGRLPDEAIRFAPQRRAIGAWLERIRCRPLHRWECLKRGQRGVLYAAVVFEGSGNKR